MVRMKLMAVLSAAVLALGLSACQGNGSGATSTDSQTVNVYIDGDTNIQDLWEKTLIPGFESANPGNKVALQFDLHGENTSQVLAKLAAATQQKKDPGIDMLEALSMAAGQAG